MCEQRYVCDCQQIVEVIPQIPLKKGLSKHVRGLINYRGLFTPVLDFTNLCSGKPAPCYLSTRIILFKREEQLLGLLAERVTDAIDKEISAFQPFLEERFVKGVAQEGKEVLYQLQVDLLFDLLQ